MFAFAAGGAIDAAVATVAFVFEFPISFMFSYPYLFFGSVAILSFSAQISLLFGNLRGDNGVQPREHWAGEPGTLFPNICAG